MEENGFVLLSDYVKKMNLVSLTPDIDISAIKLSQPDINRPALQLTGFYDYFDHDRVQVIGNVEFAYLQSLMTIERWDCFEHLCASNIPCIVFARNLHPDDEMIQRAINNNCPVYISDMTTTALTAESVRWLKVQLAPMISIHGVLVDVYGEGVLIMGESGIGKSEAALELIKRGHRLVSDDVVEIRKVSDETLVGAAPEITRHFIELRGIGIVDVKTLFGVECVKDTQVINLAIQLEDWDREKNYDRLGLEDHYVEFLGNKVVCHNIPIRPGRNLAIIVESAAVNFRQKKMGYDAARELYNRVQANMAKNFGGNN